MRRVLVLSAAAIVLAVNVLGFLQFSRNRGSSGGGELELTERELRLIPMPAENTATVLRLRWKIGGANPGEDRTAGWLDPAKLAELGFDCSVPPTDARARRHYGSTPARPAYLVLHYNRDAQGQAGAADDNETGLLVIDAGPNPARLRTLYPDPQRHIICRGLVGLLLRTHDQHGTRLDSPRLEPRVTALRPAQISVPLPYCRTLKALTRPAMDEQAEKRVSEPRFAVRVRWGSHYEPSVTTVRLLPRSESTR